MKIFTRSLFSALLVGAFLAVPATAKDAKPSAMAPSAAQDKTLTVFAAASMKNALDEVDNAYTAKSGVKIVASYAASSALAKQIEQGAPADVFMSADTTWMDYVKDKKSMRLLIKKLSDAMDETGLFQKDDDAVEEDEGNVVAAS